MSRSIRPVEKSDRDPWQALFRAYLEFYRVKPVDERIETVWNWIFDPGNDFWCDLAVDADGRAIGLAHYQLMHNSLEGSMVCYFADLFVEPTERGGGVARSLIDHVLAFAKGKGLPAVEWLTKETNYVGRRLYDTYQPKTEFVFYSVPT